MARTDTENLVVQLEARVNQFERNFQRAQKQADQSWRRIEQRTDRANRRMENSMRRAGASVVAVGRNLAGAFLPVAGGLGVVGGINAVTNAISDLDDTAKSAKAVGVTAQSLQELQFSAQLAGVETSELQRGLERMNRAVGEAAQGGERMGELFRTLGIEIRDAEGNVRSTDDVLRDLADAFSRIPDHADRARVAQELFGRSSARMINMLAQGSDELRNQAEEARRLGIVFDQETVEAAERASDAMAKFGLVVRGLVNTTVTPAIEAINSLAEAVGLLEVTRLEEIRRRLVEIDEELEKARERQGMFTNLSPELQDRFDRELECGSAWKKDPV